tara:strand:- start:656 stop:880 length:225 start_codon:yes stop_codon:yes gene_type:complete
MDNKPLTINYAVIEEITFSTQEPSYYLKETFPALLHATKYKESLETVAMLEGNNKVNYFIFELSVNNTAKVDLG